MDVSPGWGPPEVKDGLKTSGTQWLFSFSFFFLFCGSILFSGRAALLSHTQWDVVIILKYIDLLINLLCLDGSTLLSRFFSFDKPKK